jgi:predicted ATP-binding protein involved in virulence
MIIQEIHNLVLTHLLEKKQVCFSLRNQDKRNEAALRKGQWFLEVDDFLYLSFWDSYYWENEIPTISFGYDYTNEVWLLILTGKAGSENIYFLEELSKVLGLEELTESQWFKTYSYEGLSAMVESLDIFLTKDKKMIDKWIISKNKQHLFPLIAYDTFITNLNHIHFLQQQWQKHGIPTRLTMVILENIIHFNYIQINLNQQITCIIGDNGSGKSSILKAIALGLAGTKGNTVIDIKNPNIQKILRVEKIEGRKIIYANKGAITLTYSDGIVGANYIRFKNTKGDISDSRGRILRNFNKIVDEGSDLIATRGNYFTNLVLGFSQVKSLDDSKSAYPQDDGDVRPRISEVTNLIYNLPDYTFDYFATWIVQLWSVKTNPKLREMSLQILVDIFAVIQRIVGGRFELMPMQIEQTEVFIKTTDEPNGIPLRLLSQGYNNVVGWVGHFMQRLWEVTPESEKANFKKTAAICLIDEIDTYLHPKWEQKILAVLAEEFPNTQFVVTTHSPIVLANLKDNYRIYTIAKADNGQMMAFKHQKSDFNPYGASSSEVIRRLMHVQERPEPVQKLLNAYNQAIIHNDFAKATDFEAQLKQLIDPNDPEIIEGQARCLDDSTAESKSAS